ncbi:MAG: zinc-ribbon domain-containing protein [Methanoregula sp.]|nr:zinc-ribbon domain-containing protein [Methanoregula sp.]
MDDPELRGDERVLIRTNGVHVKSISFEAILTNKRIILIDRIKNVLPPKEIPLATVQTVEAGENAIRDSVISLAVVTKSGGIRQMVLTFSREGGGNRAKERDEWIYRIKENITPSFEQVMRTVIPGMDSPEDRAPETSPKFEIVGSPVQRVPAAQYDQSINRNTETREMAWQSPATPPAPAQTPTPAVELGTYCTKCGTRVPEGSGFCNKCGTRIVVPGQVPQVAVAPQYSAASQPAYKERTLNQDIQTIEPLIERSSAKIPRDPLRAVPQEPVVSTPTQASTVPQERQQAPVAPPQSAVQTAVSSGKQQKRFIPRLFSPKDLPPTPLVPRSMPNANLPPVPPSKPRSRKKLVLVAGIVVIIIIAIVAVVFVVPKLGSLGSIIPGSTGTSTTTATTTTATSGSSSGSSSTVVATRTPVSISQSGVYVYVNYIGAWKGTYGMADNIQKATNSGERSYEVENATGTVTASFWKLDSSTHDISVSIYKDGKALTTGNTTAAFGMVTLSVDVTTGVAQPVVTSGSSSVTTTTTTASSANKTSVLSTTTVNVTATTTVK